MDQIGTLELSWAQGYKGEHANYVDKDVICFQCGSCVKFIAEDGAETIFNFEGHGGIGAFAVHTSEKCFAVAEQNLNPSIYIYMYPTFRELHVLSGGAKLEFQRLVFSTSNYLATLSGVPDFELTLWDFTQGIKLATLPLTSERITSFSFNPANWRQMCVTTEKQITFLHTEQSDIHYVIQTEKVKLPSADPIEEDEEKEQDQSTRTATRMSRYTIAVPKAAIAGLVGDLAEQLDEIQDQTVHVVPVSQAWTPGGDIYIGCKGGQLLKIDGEVLKAKVLYYPPPPSQTPRSRLTSAGSKRASAVDIHSVADDIGNILVEGSLDCIKFHKRGLYAAGSDGVLRLIDTRSDEFNVIEQCNIGTCISSMSFSASYRHIAIGSPLGSFFLYEVGTPESLKLLKDYHHGQFISIGELAVTNNCVSVREDGMVQVWTSDGGQLLCSYSVGTQATSLACSPYLPVVAVGVVTGHICFVDLTNLEQPRTIQKLRIYQGPVKHLIFDDDGKYLISGSDDGHVFVFDGRPSKAFVPIGHTEVKGEVQAISTFSHDGKVRVVVMANTTGNKRNGADRITSFELSDDILKDRKKHVKSLRYEFRNESISKMSFKLGTACYGCAPTKGQIIYTLAQKTKKVNQLTLPHIEDLPKKRDDITLEPAAEYPGHQLPGGRVCLSPHHKWLASYGTDGSVLIRTVGNMDQIVSASPHDFRTGGVRSLVFSEDSHTIYTTGFDGILTCFTWNYATPSIGKSKSAVDHARAKKTRLMSIQKEEQEYLKRMEDWSPTHISRPTSGTAIISQEEKVVKPFQPNLFD
ncbi:hypothetical protein ACJMK2_005002 [Sinanodonta woodiana]|uniref:Cilia- and flagella-associated protein 43 n=1 Tax=Sinanodonta woodiana TaxID=1069815 RepID=A0ABD3VNR1_SINWO